MSENAPEPWGRVDDDGTVYVREGEEWRRVGQYPDGTPDEALAYFTRKYSELEGQVMLLERRVNTGVAGKEAAATIATLREQITGANAVGDLNGLAERLEALQAPLEELAAQREAEQKAELQQALAHREAIVVEAEQLAAQDPAKIQWKQTSAQMEALFARWQEHQQTGPRLGKAEANALWKRFRAARATIDTARRAFFSELDAAHKTARDAKEKIIARAEALASRGADAVGDYRRLLDEWKTVGRAGKKHDDALWARFKAAGDVLFAAKSEVDARENAEYTANLEAKEALLAKAQPILEMTDRKAAREQLSNIQRKWDEIGRVPRDHFKAIEERLRKVEAHVRKLDDEHWQATNPEKQARTSGLQAQLDAAIEKLEQELAAAEAKGDAKAAKEARDALEARRTWRAALG